MKTEQRIERVCPLCGQSYRQHPAISREDNKTEICPDCGTRQALTMMNVSEEDIDHIIRIIHKTVQND